MRTVYKYAIERIESKGELTLMLPSDAVIVHVGIDPNGKVCIWCELDPERPQVPRQLYVKATGDPIEDGLRHIGSFVNPPFVWHVYQSRWIQG